MRARRNGQTVSFRIITAVVLAVGVLGVAIAVAAGILKIPHNAGTARALDASPLARGQAGLITGTSAPRATPKPSAHSAMPAVDPSTPRASSPPSRPLTSSTPGLVPTATAEYQTPKGSNELAWSEAILKQLGDPLTDANIISMGYWMQNEAGSPPYGIVGANNPINVSQPGYGGTPIRSEGDGYYLYSYPTVMDGIEAIVAYLNRPSYYGIVAALKAGVGLSSSSLASEFYVYSGNSYGTVPDSWGASQGRPET